MSILTAAPEGAVLAAMRSCPPSAPAIAHGVNVVLDARRLGHASPATSLSIDVHLFDEAANIDRVQEYVNGQFANLHGLTSATKDAA